MPLHEFLEPSFGASVLSASGPYSDLQDVATPEADDALDACPSLRTKPLPDGYRNEQVNATFRGDPSLWDGPSDTGTHFSKIVTRYMSDAEQQDATLKVKDGKLQTAAGDLNTIGNSGKGTQFEGGANKSIFAMTSSGDFRTTAAWEGHREIAEDPTHNTLSMLNHSSLLAESGAGGARVAGEAAAAGELQAERGKLQMLSDASGHYKPDNGMTYQALSGLSGMGLDMHDLALKLTPKGNLDLDSENPAERYLYASAREFMGYQGDGNAEGKMRFDRQYRRNKISSAAEDRRQERASAPSPVVDPRAARDRDFLASLRGHLFQGQYE